ncbi:MAG TPA: SRPBCC domain-containing protein [Ktedonobacterales bacterium]|nr:SRPBCC domain-containing protein [Ktedonobacterales bacterium]
MTGANPADSRATEVVVTRIFNAPRALVFNFWTAPEHLAQWWGPEGFQLPGEDLIVDRRVGGRYQLHLVEDATGAEVWVHGEIVEFVEPEMLAIQMDVPQPIGLPPMKTIVRVRFDDLGEKTRVTLRQGPFETAEQREQTASGWGQSFDKLDQLLIPSNQPG